jgi:flagellar basal-body rod protein FlgB
MSAMDPIGGAVTSQLVSIALDAALARHTAIAANIANVDTPDYRPMTARFDQIVEELQGRVTDRSLDASTALEARRIEESLASSPWVVDPTASKVELDMQMAKLAKNTVQYQALLTAQGKLMGMEELVISEGRT